jgi:hypothetical protein
VICGRSHEHIEKEVFFNQMADLPGTTVENRSENGQLKFRVDPKQGNKEI